MLWIVLFFLFQAEDGIRDLVRSRGLGDVYKRQGLIGVGGVPLTFQQFSELVGVGDLLGFDVGVADEQQAGHVEVDDLIAVSYTHLTLPTSDLG